MSDNLPPFATNTVAPVAPAPPAPPAAPVTTAPAVESVKKDRRPAPDTPANAVQFITANMKTMSYSEMAAALSTPDNTLIARDVNNIIQRIKKMMRDSAGKEGYAMKTLTNKKTGKEKVVQDFSQPLTEQAKKVEEWIVVTLSRPAEAKVGAPGGQKKESQMNQALKGDIESILASL